MEAEAYDCSLQRFLFRAVNLQNRQAVKRMCMPLYCADTNHQAALILIPMKYIIIQYMYVLELVLLLLLNDYCLLTMF